MKTGINPILTFALASKNASYQVNFPMHERKREVPASATVTAMAHMILMVLEGNSQRTTVL